MAIQYLGNYHLFDGPVDDLFNLNLSHRNALFFSYSFFALGYLTRRHELHALGSQRTVYLALIAGTFLLTAEVGLNYLLAVDDRSFDNYFSLIFVCPALFLSVTRVSIEGDSKSLSLYASAIYFVPRASEPLRSGRQCGWNGADGCCDTPVDRGRLSSGEGEQPGAIHPLARDRRERSRPWLLKKPARNLDATRSCGLARIAWRGYEHV